MTFQFLFFQLYFNKKYVELAINDFTMHLIISKWLRRKKYRQKRKRMRQRLRRKRRNCLRKCFYLLKYVIDHENVGFFFLFSLRTCSKSLKDYIVYTTSILLAASFKHLRTDRATECVFRASGSTLFKNFPTLRQPWWCLYQFN